jgi:hypothetical protein
VLVRTIIALLIISSVGCQSEPWDDKYFIKSSSKGHNDLTCTSEEANDIASRAIKKKYPRHYKRFLEKRFTLFSPVYGNFGGVMQSRYNFKTILGYKKIEHSTYNGSYYQESIEVSLSKECEVLDVVYFKGKVQYTE